MEENKSINNIKLKFENKVNSKENPLISNEKKNSLETIDIADNNENRFVTRKSRADSVIDRSYEKIVEEFFVLGECKYPFGFDNLALIITKVMEHVETNNNELSGPSKKDLVIKITNKLMNDLDVIEDDKVILEKTGTKIISNYIDVLVSITKGQFNINRKVKPKRCFLF